MPQALQKPTVVPLSVNFGNLTTSSLKKTQRLLRCKLAPPTQLKICKRRQIGSFPQGFGVKIKKSLKPKPPMQIHKIFTGVPSKYSSEGNPPTRCASKETSRKTVLSPEAYALPNKTGKCVCVCAFFKFALTDLMGRGFFSTSDQKHPPKRSILHEVLPSHPPRSHQWCIGHERQKKTRDNIPNSEKAVCWTTFIRHFFYIRHCATLRRTFRGLPTTVSATFARTFNTIFLGTFPQNLPVEWRNLCWNFPGTCS